MGFVKQNIIALFPSVIAVLIFTLGVGIFYFFSPSAQSLKTLKTQATQVKNEIESINTEELPQLREKNLAFSNIQGNFQNFMEKTLEAQKRIPGKEDFGSFVDQLFLAAKESEVEFFRVEYKGEENLKDCNQLSLEIQVKSGFPKLGRYIEKIEKMQRITTIDRFNINRVDYGSQVEAKLFVSTYFIKE
jgi:Tfp pilus assembly protein PilO